MLFSRRSLLTKILLTKPLRFSLPPSLNQNSFKKPNPSGSLSLSMTAPNMATITAALERSLKNCSLGSGNSANSPASDLPNEETSASSLDLDSHLALPYEWEQCLDLKTGEIYYINWRNGMKVKEDPRKIEPFEGDYYSEEDSSGESEGSSSASSPCSRDDYQRYHKDHVLVVAGCKSCLMYFMLPKTVFVCPKCNGTILHFDREENGYL